MVPACQLACFKPSESLAGLINDLQSSIATYEELHEPQTNQTFFTDRKYYHRNMLNHQSSSHSLEKPLIEFSNTPQKRCRICRKEGCWSTNHSKEERKNYLNQYRQKLDKKVDTHICQYAVELEAIEENNPASDESDTESIKGTIEALVLEVGTLPASKTSDEQYFTSVGYVVNAKVMADCLANKAFEHANITEVPRHSEEIGQPNFEKFLYTFTSTSHSNRYNSSNFHGIMIDTGASKISTAGYDQYIACQKFNSYVKIDKSKAGAINVQFGIGSTPSIGSFKLNTPVGVTEFHVIHADTPFLLCLADMDRLKIYYNNVDNVLVTSTGNRIPVVRQFGHPFLTWGESLQNFL